MALFSDELAAAMVDDFIPRAFDQVLKRTPGLSHFLRRRREARSSPVRVELLLAKSGNFTSYRRNQAIPLLQERHIDAAKYPIAQFVDAVVLAEDEMDWSAGPMSAIRLMETKSEMLSRSFLESLSAEFYGANDASDTTLCGMRRAVSATASDDVGGLDTNDYSAWAPAKVDSATTLAGLTKATLESVIGKIQETGNVPNLGLTTQAIWDKIADLYSDVFRIFNSQSLEAGWNSIKIRGVEIVSDPHCPANHLFLMDDGYIEIAIHPKHDFRKQALPRIADQFSVGVTLDAWLQVLYQQRRALAAFTALA